MDNLSLNTITFTPYNDFSIKENAESTPSTVGVLQSDKTQSVADKAIQVVSKEQILSLCKCILAGIGKELKTEVRQEFFGSQIAKLEGLIKEIEGAERVRVREIKNTLIEILAEDVDYSPRFKEIERGKVYKDYNEFLSWNMNFNTYILWKNIHPLTYLELPSNLLPDSWQDLLPLSREKYFRAYLSKIESFRGNLLGDENFFDSAIVSLAKRSEDYGFFDYIDKTLLNKINSTDVRFSFEFDYSLRRKDFKRALDCAYKMLTKDEDLERFTEKVLWAAVKERGIGSALELVLTLPRKERYQVDADDSLKRIKSNRVTLRYVTLNKLLFYVCQIEGIGKAIEFVKAIPYPIDRAIVVNHLIFRLTQKDAYVRRWDGYFCFSFQEVFKSEKEKAQESDEIFKINAIKDREESQKAFEEFEDRFSLKRENLQEDIDKAIELFNQFPVGKLTKSKAQEEILTSLRSMYIIEALLRKEDLKTAKKFLPAFRGDKTGLERYVYRYEQLLGLEGTPIYRTVSQFEESQR